MGTKAVEKFRQGKFVANLTLESQETPPFTFHLIVIEREGSTLEPGESWYEGSIVAVRDFPAGDEPHPSHILKILKKLESDDKYFEKYAVDPQQGSGVW